MDKSIRMIIINKVKMCLLRIFEAEDDDIPDYRVIKANNRALDRYLKDYTKEQQYELLNLIRWDNDNCVSELEKAGWKVVRGK